MIDKLKKEQEEKEREIQRIKEEKQKEIDAYENDDIGMIQTK